MAGPATSGDRNLLVPRTSSWLRCQTSAHPVGRRGLQDRVAEDRADVVGDTGHRQEQRRQRERRQDVAAEGLTAAATERPSFLHTDLRGLTEPHPAPVRVVREGQEWWQVGGRCARVVDSGLELDGVGTVTSQTGGSVRIDLDSYRALAVAAWAWADAQVARGEAAALELPEIEVIEP